MSLVLWKQPVGQSLYKTRSLANSFHILEKSSKFAFLYSLIREWSLTGPPHYGSHALLLWISSIISIGHLFVWCSPEDALVRDPPAFLPGCTAFFTADLSLLRWSNSGYSHLPMEMFPTMLIFSICIVWDSVCTIREGGKYLLLSFCWNPKGTKADVMKLSFQHTHAELYQIILWLMISYYRPI